VERLNSLETRHLVHPVSVTWRRPVKAAICASVLGAFSLCSPSVGGDAVRLIPLADLAFAAEITRAAT
jgi:hypothetical protein